MKRVMLIGLMVLSGTIVACADGTNFAGLQNDFDIVMQQRAACVGQPDRPACLDAREAELLNIAMNAKAQARQAQDERTRIGLLRLAAVAAWQAGPAGYGTALAAADEGSVLCQVEPTVGRHGPRDCALLAVLPGLVESDALRPKIVRLQRDLDGLTAQADLSIQERAARQRLRVAQREAPGTPAGLPDLVGPYYDRAWRPAAASWSRICRIQGLSEDVTAYVLAQQRRMLELYKTVRDASGYLDGGAVPLNDSHCAAMGLGTNPLAGSVDALRVEAWCHTREMERSIPRSPREACAL